MPNILNKYSFISIKTIENEKFSLFKRLKENIIARNSFNFFHFFNLQSAIILYSFLYRYIFIMFL